VRLEQRQARSVACYTADSHSGITAPRRQRRWDGGRHHNASNMASSKKTGKQKHGVISAKHKAVAVAASTRAEHRGASRSRNARVNARAAKTQRIGYVFHRNNASADDKRAFSQHRGSRLCRLSKSKKHMAAS